MIDIITHSNSGMSQQALQQQAERKRVVRLFRGAYVKTQEYETLDIAGKYRTCAKAFLATHPKLKAWGITAAALDGAPVLEGAPLHFAGPRNNAKSKQKGCIFHEALPTAPFEHNQLAGVLFECAVASPLPDALLAANHLLRSVATEANGNLVASRDIDEKTTEALVWQPISNQTRKVHVPNTPAASTPTTDNPNFLDAYRNAHSAGFLSPAAELIWQDYAKLCVLHGTRRGVRKAIRAGLYFSDQPESPAESLLVARCAELSFKVPYLQVNIFDPSNGRHLGRVDGLWPSSTVMDGLYQSDSRFGRYLQCRQLGDSDSVIIEFDGRLKYQQDYVEALEKERQRQNAIGNLGFRFVRISWADLMQPDRLSSILKAAKVPTSRHR